MSAATDGWIFMGHISPNDRTARFYSDTDRIYRVRDTDDAIRALGFPTAGVSGVLYARPRIAPFVAAAGVGVAAFSKGTR